MTYMIMKAGCTQDSKTPRRKRTAIREAKLCVAAEQAITTPQQNTLAERYFDTGSRWSSKFVGYSPTSTPIYKIVPSQLKIEGDLVSWLSWWSQMWITFTYILDLVDLHLPWYSWQKQILGSLCPRIGRSMFLACMLIFSCWPPKTTSYWFHRRYGFQLRRRMLQSFDCELCAYL